MMNELSEILGAIFLPVFFSVSVFLLGAIIASPTPEDIELKEKACAWIYENEEYDTYIYYCK